MKYHLFDDQGSKTAEVGNGEGENMAPTEAREAEFQLFKTKIHRELLDSLDLSRLTDLDEVELKQHIRRLAEGILRNRSDVSVKVDEERLFDELIAETKKKG